MRIGFDAKRLFNNYTGLGNYARTLVKNYAILFPNNNLSLYATHSNKNEKTSFFYKCKNIKLFFSKAFIKPIWRSFTIIKDLRKDNIDLYIGLTNELPFGIQKTGIKSIVVIHDLIFKIYPETYPFIDRFVYDYKFKYACKSATKIIAISEQTKRDIITYYNIAANKIEVLYQSCDEQFFLKNELSRSLLDIYNIPQFYNLYVGSVNERKNLKSIIKAYAYLEGKDLIPMIIIGNGKKYKEECIQLIKDLNLTNYFIWVSNMYDVKHLQLAYQHANTFIYPSFYEGFGIPIIEALLSKTPVITSNISSLPEAAGDNAVFINPSKPLEIANAIRLINSDIKIKYKLKENGYSYCMKKFNFSSVSEKLELLVQNLNV